MEEIKNPVKAIRAYCIGCCNGSATEVAACSVTKCELYAFRFGKNPYRTKKVYTEEQKEQMRDRMNRIRLAARKNGESI